MNFYLKKSESDTNLIMGVIYDAQFHDGRFVYSTGERIEPKNWGQGKPKKKHEDLTERLLEISKQATSFIRLNRSHLTKEALKAHLDGLRPREKKPLSKSKADTKTMITLWSEYLQSLKDIVAPRTYKSYYNSFDTLRSKSNAKRKSTNFKSFLISKSWTDIAPDKFTATHFNLYHGYLKKNTKPNTTAKRLKHLKAFLEHLIDDLKLQVGMDIEKIKYRETPGLKISLSEEQLQTYIDAEIPERSLDEVRDLWVIQCSLGPRVGDLNRLDKNIRGDKIFIETQKTGKTIEIKIHPTVRRILEKHNYQLPKISEQHYRKGIKTLHRRFFEVDTIQVREGNEFKDVPVWEEISTHDAVRTFITLSAERGMTVSSIAKITGKSVKVILSNYLVESQKTADKEMDKAWGTSPLKVAR